MLTRIESLAAFVPETVVTSERLIAELDCPVRVDLAALTGIRERRVRRAPPDGADDSYLFALRAARDCLSRSRYRPRDLDVVISASITRLHEGPRMRWEPSFAALLCRETGAASALHFDLSNACAGMFSGVLVLDRMIKAGTVRNGMVVSGECVTTITDTALREITGLRDKRLASLTVGDSASAVIMDAATDDAPDRVHYVEQMTSGSFARLCLAGPSGPHTGMSMFTDSRALHDTSVMEQWPALYRAFLARTGRPFTPGDFDHLIAHQVSRSFIDRVKEAGEKGVGPMPPMLSSLERYGNTASNSLFVTLHDHLASRSEGPSTYLLVASASGFVAGFMALTISPPGEPT
ncbi:3-oxoacyl-[acyl-carrier-protein] synthase III C-terminal domain-containing protein [Streptomyces sp. NPDC050095]|uniref:3-oxoacyl-ACP synthase III family protein n=1 Tax=unclassified Streptomyces TaxID=2593676 RepID=UPI003413F823